MHQGGNTLREKDLKKLNRYQLLELLVVQTERADQLQRKVEELEGRLEERDLNLSKLGSIAEAALQVSGVFEASQKAADLYWAAAKKQADDLLAHARHQAASMMVQAEVNVQCISCAEQESGNIVTGKRNANDQ